MYLFIQLAAYWDNDRKLLTAATALHTLSDLLSLLNECNHVSATYHSLLPDDRHPVLHAVHSVWDLGEVVFSEGLLAHREGAVVCSRHT